MRARTVIEVLARLWAHYPGSTCFLLTVALLIAVINQAGW